MTRRFAAALIATLASIAVVLQVHADESWPQFRGPTGQGVATGKPAPTVWSETEGVRWKTRIPGRGWSSPVVLGDQIWLTTAIEQAASESEVEAKVAGGLPASQLALAERLSLRAVAVDRQTGVIAHDVELFDARDVEVVHLLNSYASPTPVLEPGRLYCHFGAYGNACVDTSTGEVLWRRVIPVKHYVGPGSSPVVCDDVLVLTYDGADQQFVTGLDKATGEVIWKTERPPIRETNPDFRKAYCTPLVVEHAERTHVVVTGAQWCVAYDPATGDERWRVDHGRGFSTVPRPVEANGVVYFSSGFMSEQMFAVRLGDGDDAASGDVTDSHVLWRAKRQTPTQASPLLVGDRLFTVSDNGVGVALDTRTGQALWQGRLGGAYSASPLLSGGRVYFFSREGKTTIVDPTGDKPAIERPNELDGTIMASPAVVDGELYLRAGDHLYAIGG